MKTENPIQNKTQDGQERGSQEDAYMEDRKDKMEEEIEEQAKYVAYLSQIKVSEIKDKLSRELVQEVLASSQRRKDKAESIERIMAQSEIKNLLEKVEKTGHVINNVAFKKLKGFEKQGRNLKQDELSECKLVVQICNEDLEKKGKAALSLGIEKEVIFEDLNFFDKLDYKMKERMKQRCQVL